MDTAEAVGGWDGHPDPAASLPGTPLVARRPVSNEPSAGAAAAEAGSEATGEPVNSGEPVTHEADAVADAAESSSTSVGVDGPSNSGEPQGGAEAVLQAAPEGDPQGGPGGTEQQQGEGEVPEAQDGEAGREASATQADVAGEGASAQDPPARASAESSLGSTEQGFGRDQGQERGQGEQDVNADLGQQQQEPQHQQPGAEAADAPHAEGSKGSLQGRLAGAAGDPADGEQEQEHVHGRDSRPHSAHSASSHRASSSLGPSASASPQNPSSPTRQLSAQSQRGSEVLDPGPPALAPQRSTPVVPPINLPPSSPFTVGQAAARREVRAPSPLPEELEVFTAVYGSHREVSSAGPTPRTTTVGMGSGSNPGTGPGMLPAWGPGAARVSIGGATVSGQAVPGRGPVVGPFAERIPHQGASPGEPALGSGKRSGLGSSAGRHAHGTVHHGSPGHWAAGRAPAGWPAGQAGHVPSPGFKPHGARTPPSRDADGLGTPGASQPPPLTRVPSRERAGGHAAGGGAAAVKAAAAAAAAAGAATPEAAAEELGQALGGAMHIKRINKQASGAAGASARPESLAAAGAGGGGMACAGVPGRRGRRLPAAPAATWSAASLASAYGGGVEALLAAGAEQASAGTALLPGGLMKRLKAARVMAAAPPPFQRGRSQAPPTPAGVKLDGFMLLEAADEDLPEAVTAASVAGRAVSDVERADLSYFIALRALDVSDNRLPDLMSLALLPALVSLRAASCRLATLGTWQAPEAPAEEAEAEAGVEGPGEEAEAGEEGPGEEAEAAAGKAVLSAPALTAPFMYLESLDLSFNSLQAHMVLLPGTPLARLPRLTELDLSSNGLKHLPAPGEVVKAAVAAATAAVGAAAGGGAAEAALAAATAFPALRRLRLADNGLRSAAIASIAALGPPLLMHLDLSRNSITDSGLAGSVSAAQQQQQQQHQLPGGPLLPHLAVLDLSYNRVAAEAAVTPLLQRLPGLQRLLLAGNPLAAAASRALAKSGETHPWAAKLVYGSHDASGAGGGGPLSSASSASSMSSSGYGATGPGGKPSVAASLTARFAKVDETPPTQMPGAKGGKKGGANGVLAAAAAAAITAAVVPEHVTEVFDRTEQAIEQWKLNTVMEEEEEEEEEEDGEAAGPDGTFLTGVGISEKRRRGGAAADDDEADDGDGEGTEAPAEEPPQPEPSAAAAAAPPGEEVPLWESISDPTERLAVALGLDPLTLPMHTGVLTTDSAGTIAALRFALAHPLVDPDEGLGPVPGYTATTAAAALKRRPRRPAPSQRLAPMGAAAAAAAATPAGAGAAGGGAVSSPRAVKIQTVEGMLEGMKGRLAALEASLAAQLAAAPAVPSPEAVRAAAEAAKGRYGLQRPKQRKGRPDGGADDSDSDSEGGDGDSDLSDLPDDVIDEIERESSESEDEEEEAPLDPRQGIVLLADTILGGEDSNNSGSNNTAAPADGVQQQQQQQQPGGPRTPGQPGSVSIAASPSRKLSISPVPSGGGANAAGTPVAGAQRRMGSMSALKGAPGGGAPVALPNSAASALGYS